MKKQKFSSKKQKIQTKILGLKTTSNKNLKKKRLFQKNTGTKLKCFQLTNLEKLEQQNKPCGIITQNTK